jgi:hypothetical protein
VLPQFQEEVRRVSWHFHIPSSQTKNVIYLSLCTKIAHQQEFLKYITCIKWPITNVGKRFVSQLECLIFNHDKRCRGSIYQKWGIGRRVCPVLWFGKGQFEFRHAIVHAICLDAIFLSNPCRRQLLPY